MYPGLYPVSHICEKKQPVFFVKPVNGFLRPLVVSSEVKTFLFHYRFFTKDGVAVVMRPDTEEQREQSHWMEQMWKINHLGNCGPVFAVEFAEQHNIKYAYQMVV